MLRPVHELARDLHSLVGDALSPLLSIADEVLAPIQDTWITVKARLTVMAVAADGGRGVDIETHRGCVTLTGQVSSWQVSTRLARAVAALTDVVNVRNHLRVTEAAGASCHSDAEIERAVETRLRSHHLLCRSHIRVQAVYDGIVRLAGAARSEDEEAAAFEEALATFGVRRVTSEVVINPLIPVRNLAGFLGPRAVQRDATAA
jgi:osmotically-inducible protein OsmY